MSGRQELTPVGLVAGGGDPMDADIPHGTEMTGVPPAAGGVGVVERGSYPHEYHPIPFPAYRGRGRSGHVESVVIRMAVAEGYAPGFPSGISKLKLVAEKKPHPAGHEYRIPCASHGSGYLHCHPVRCEVHEALRLLMLIHGRGNNNQSGNDRHRSENTDYSHLFSFLVKLLNLHPGN